MAGIILDTNVLSELMRPQPDAAVIDWFAKQRDVFFYVTAITVAEILLGISLLPAGKRKDALATAAETMFSEDFADRCLPFDASCAANYAALTTERRASGKPITVEEAQIAAIALANNFALATRNLRDFTDISGLRLVNLWLRGC